MATSIDGTCALMVANSFDRLPLRTQDWLQRLTVRIGEQHEGAGQQ